jgi:hypothetical protein
MKPAKEPAFYVVLPKHTLAAWLQWNTWVGFYRALFRQWVAYLNYVYR